MEPQTPQYFTRQEAAAYLGVSVDTIDRWARTGLIAKVTAPGRRTRYVRFDRAELDRASGRQTPNETAPGRRVRAESGGLDRPVEATV